MRITTSGKNMEVTDALKDTIERKLSKLDKFFHKDTEIQVTLSVEKSRHIIEVTIPFNGILIRAEESTKDMYTSIDKALDKLERQINKHKTKLEKRYRGSKMLFDNVHTDGKEKSDGPRVVRTKRFPMKPMPVEEAILQMELLGHNFFMFSNGDTDEVNVIYKRKDGNYGLIEPLF